MAHHRGPSFLIFVGLVCLAAGAVPVMFHALSAEAEPTTALQWPVHLGPCGGEHCPIDGYPVVTETYTGYVDENVETYVGGDFSAVRAAEAEGITVVGGGFITSPDIDYSVGLVGAGSQVRPPAYSNALPTYEYALQVGGDIVVGAGGNVYVGSSGDDYPLSVDYAGSLTGSVSAYQILQSANARTDWPTTTSDLGSLSTALSDPTQFLDVGIGTVTASSTGNEIYFEGDGVSPFQFFTVTGNLETADQQNVTVTFGEIPESASVFVNFTGSVNAMHVNVVQSEFSEPDLATRLMWNFPNSDSIEIVTGTADLPGTILVGGRDSTTSINVPGVDGRVYVAGNLIHHSRGDTGGQEIHSYAFTGALPSYGPTTSSPPTSSPPTSSPPTSSPPTTQPTTSAPETSPGTSTPTPSVSGASLSASTPNASASSTGGSAGRLVYTGVAEYLRWIVPVAFASALLGTVIVVYVRRRLVR